MNFTNQEYFICGEVNTLVNLHSTSYCLSVYLSAIRHTRWVGDQQSLSSLQTGLPPKLSSCTHYHWLNGVAFGRGILTQVRKLAKPGKPGSGYKGEQADSWAVANNEDHNTVSFMWSLIPERNLIDCCDLIWINQLINSAFILIRNNRIILTRLGMLE